MRNSAEGVRTNSQLTFSRGPHHTDKQVLDVRLELIYNRCSLDDQSNEWMIETNGERASGKSLLAALHDDDDDDADREREDKKNKERDV